MNMELAVVQLIAYVTLTLGSVTVAAVSLMFAYRQNFGWKPLALVTSHGLHGGLGAGEYYGAILNFEVWNRRKYPIAIRACHVKFSVLEIERVPSEGDGSDPEWITGNAKQVFSRKEVVLGPNEHRGYKLDALFKKRTLDELVDPVTIKVTYFDPRKNRTYPITFEYTYHMGALDKKM